MTHYAFEKTNTESLSQLQPKPASSDFWLTAQTNVRLKQRLTAIKAVPRNEALSLSFNQERLWLLEQLQPGTSVHNLLHIIRLNGALNVTALEQSLNEIVQRHEILRTAFPVVDGKPIQAIALDISWQLPIVDLQHLPPDQREAEAHRFGLADAEQLFDLANGPLWRFTLLRLADEEHLLVRTIHHIIFDGWSHNVFMRELGVLYEALAMGKSSPLSTLPIQYADFAQAQRQWFQNEDFLSQVDYWKQQLSGNVAALELPTDYPRPSVPSYRGQCQSLVLLQELTALKALSYQQGVSLFATLLAAFKTVLYCYTKQEDMLVCSPVASRQRSETKGLIGYFNNVVVLRTDLSGNPCFRQLLSRVSQATLGAYANQDVPLQKLAELPHLARVPLTRAMFVLQNIPNQTLNLEGLQVSSQYVERSANFDLSLSLQEQAGQLTGVVQCKTDLFDDASITQMLERFQILLKSLVEDPSRRLFDLPFWGSTQLQQDVLDQKPSSTPSEQIASLVAPQDELELQLLKIWEQVLGLDSISVKDNFFDLGGHSLLAVYLFAQIEQSLGVNLPLATLLQAPTIEQLAHTIRQSESTATWHELVPLQTSGCRPPLFCIHGGGFNVLIYRDLANHFGSEQPVYALQARGLDGKTKPHSRIEDMAADYIKHICTVQPEGPYLLAGLSNGGVIALEMAQQLRLQGQKVALLAMFDTYGPIEREFLPPIPRFFSVLNYVISYTLPRFLSKQLQLKAQLKFTQILERIKSFNWVGASKPQTSAEPLIDLIKQPEPKPNDSTSKLAKVSYMELWIHKLNMFVLSHSPWAWAYKPTADLMGIEGTLSQTVQQLEAVHNQANRKYVPRPYPGCITLFRASEQPPGFRCDPYYGWGEILTTDMEVHDVPGHHTSIMNSPVLARKLKPCIDKALLES